MIFKRLDEYAVTVAVPLVRSLNAHSGLALTRQLASAVGPAARLLLDLGHVEFTDGPAWGPVLTYHRELKEQGGDVKLCALRPAVRRTFELLRLHRRIDLFNTQEEALCAFRLGSAWPQAAFPPQHTRTVRDLREAPL